MVLKRFGVLWATRCNLILFSWIFECPSVSIIANFNCSTLIWILTKMSVDGEAAARMIKSTNNINRNTPIIAVTAYERTLQLASVFDDTLCKPVTKEIVSRCIRHLSELQANSNAIHWSSSSNASTHQPQQHPIESLFPLSTSSSPVNVKDTFSYPHHQH